MTAALDDPTRRLVPRWRPSAITVALGELSSAAGTPRVWEPNRESLAQREAEWAIHRSPAFAADFVSTALVLGRPQRAREAAEFLITGGARVSITAKTLAARVLGRGGSAMDAPPAFGVDVHRQEIRRLRSRLVDAPRASIWWVDLALEYAILGEREKAAEMMRRALILSPEDRFVLRAAARLYLHTDEKDRAHAVIRRSGRVFSDPWLLATEIATSQVIGKTSDLIKRGRSAVTSGRFHPHDITELAGAIASVDMETGTAKDARRMFGVAIKNPNDNALAQAAWAGRRRSGITVSEGLVERVPRTFEVAAWRQYTAGNWQEALRESYEWVADEPFASRAAEFSSYLAAAAAEDFAASIRIADRGLASNPNDALLLNNKAAALAHLGKVAEARAVMERLLTVHNHTSPTHTAATAGLICFRDGDPDTGRMLYRTALERAERGPNRNEVRAAALYYLAREEARARTPFAAAAIAEACESLRSAKSPIAPLYLRRLKEVVEQRELEPGSAPA